MSLRFFATGTHGLSSSPSARFPRLTRTRLVALAALTGALGLVGCNGEVLVSGSRGAGGGGGDGAAGGGGAHPTCPPPVGGEVPESVVALANVRSASFVGEHLHLQAEVDGVDQYVVLELNSQYTAELVAVVEEMRGPAHLAKVAPGIRGRIRVDEGGSHHVDVVDVGAEDSDPASPEKPGGVTVPQIIGGLDLKGIVNPPDVYSMADDRLFFCMSAAEGEDPELYEVDLSEPAAPEEPELIDSFLCNLYDESTFAAEGRSWLATNVPTGNFVQDVHIYLVGEEGALGTVSYGYNQTGVHQYGNALFTGTSELRAVIDPENDSLFLVADAASAAGGYDWVSFTVGTERRLLGVVDATAYLITPESLRAYDVTDIHDPELTDYEAEVVLDDAAPKLVASSDRYLVIAGGAERLYLAPREAPGKLVPLVVYEAGKAPPEAPCP